MDQKLGPALLIRLRTRFQLEMSSIGGSQCIGGGHCAFFLPGTFVTMPLQLALWEAVRYARFPGVTLRGIVWE